MKIGIISSYLPIHCGIATYSSYLIEELRRLGNRVYIVCHKGGKGLDCYPTFNYILSAIREEKDLTVILHSISMIRTCLIKLLRQ
jgi:hypothetical protein